MARNQQNQRNRRSRNPLVTPFLTDKQIEAQAKRLAALAAGPAGAVSLPYERERINMESLGKAYGEALKGTGEASAANIALLQGAAGGYGAGALAGASTAALQAASAAPAMAQAFVRGKQAESLGRQTKAEEEYTTRKSGLTAQFMEQLRTREMEKAASLAELETTAKALGYKYDVLASEERRFYDKLAADAKNLATKIAADAAKAGGLTKNKLFKEISSFVNERVDKSSTTKIPSGFTGTVVFKYKPTPEQVASGNIAIDASGFAVSDPVTFDWKDSADLDRKIAGQYPAYKKGSAMIQSQDTREDSQKVYTYSLPALRKQAISIAIANGYSPADARILVAQIFTGITR